MERIVIGMSGGVDSSVAALLLKEQGYDETVYHFQNEQKDTFKRYDGDVESNEKRYAVYIKEF